MSKTITDNTDQISRYIFDDNVELVVSEEYIRTPDFIIGDLKPNTQYYIKLFSIYSGK